MLVKIQKKIKFATKDMKQLCRRKLSMQTNRKPSKQSIRVPNKIIESIAKRNGIKTGDIASLTYTQVLQLEGVGKKTAQTICEKYGIDPVKPRKQILLVNENKDQIVLYLRQKGKKKKRLVWDFPDSGTVPISNERDMGQFRFYHEEISIIACTMLDCPKENTCFKVILVPDLISQISGGMLPVHDRVLKYLEQRTLSFEHIFTNM